MSDPRRLWDEGEGPGADLLRSAKHDQPSSGAKDKTLVALGVAGGVGAAVTATSSTAAALGIAKWIGAGIAIGLITAGSAGLLQPPAEAPAPPASARHVAPPIRARIASAPREEAPREASPPDPSPSSSAEVVPARSAPRVEPSASAKAERPSLAEEVALLDRAREAVAAGDAGRALTALDEHTRRFPGGALGQEALVLRIEALSMRGDRAAATRLGESFLKSFPQSPLAPRVRSRLGLPPPPAEGP